MPEPKKKTTKSKGKQRRKGKKLKPAQLVKCSHCGQEKQAHRICPNCNYFDKEEIKGV